MWVRRLSVCRHHCRHRRRSELFARGEKRESRSGQRSALSCQRTQDHGPTDCGRFFHRTSGCNVGSKEFDPVKVGYEEGPIAGGFQLDTSKPGNSNAGHKFSRDFNEKSVKGRGIIGRYLNEEERWSLIEYLKTL